MGLSLSIPISVLQWSFGGGSLSHSRETVNTAIVDIYQQGGDEPVLKSRVRCNSDLYIGLFGEPNESCLIFLWQMLKDQW